MSISDHTIQKPTDSMWTATPYPLPSEPTKPIIQKVIAYDQYLRLLGLAALAKKLQAKIDIIYNSALLITGEDADDEHTYGIIYNDSDVDGLLAKLNIKVEE